MSNHGLSFRRVVKALALSCFLSGSAGAQVYQLAELNVDQIRKLDRERTVILLPGGIMEEHGPYLPSYTDGYFNERITKDLAAAIANRPGWTAVLFPVIPLGSGGANEIGAKYVFPGTYAVRPATLRAVFMDLATEFGEQGFRWLFVIHGHGSPSHNRVLDEAGDYFRDTYGGHMVHLTGLVSSPSVIDSLRAEMSEAVLAEDGFTVHAGVLEHSRLMALRPDLVSREVVKAPSLTAKDFVGLRRLAEREDWTGYFGAPRYASAALGRRDVEERVREHIAQALRILDGLDERRIPRYSAIIAKVPGISEMIDRSLKRDDTIEKRQREWLAKRGQR